MSKFFPAASTPILYYPPLFQDQEEHALLLLNGSLRASNSPFPNLGPLFFLHLILYVENLSAGNSRLFVILKTLAF